ncbi:MAG: hypothetical protein ABR924_03865 [Terracidiphilus sp.]|jgi:hypothetical protein
MRRTVISAVLFSLCISLPALLIAGSLENQGKAWLDAQTEPPAINVNGTWDSEFGDIHLSQAAGSREVSGIGGGYELTGVVSGKRLYLLFSIGGSVDYCATVSYESDNSLTGTYSNRVSRHQAKSGLCQGPEKSRPLFMSKKKE